MKANGRILIACDKFNGSLTADEACSALARGLGIRFPGASIVTHPIADGGEGFAASLEKPLGGKWVEVPVCDALGRRITARYLLARTPDGRSSPSAATPRRKSATEDYSTSFRRSMPPACRWRD